jgi:hypothetical protein
VSARAAALRTLEPAPPGHVAKPLAAPVVGGRLLARAARGATRPRILALALLRQGAGNGAVARVLARVKRYEGLYANPKYASTIYPFREGLLKRFVSIYRYMELKEASEEQVKAAWDAVRKAMQAEVDRLAALPTPAKQDLAKKKELEAILKQGKLSLDQMAYKTGEWEARLLAGGDVWKEVQRHFASGRVPDWFKPIVQHYSGMRYLSAHGFYHSPRRLLYVLAYQEAEAAAKAARTKKVSVDPAVVKELKDLSDDAVLDRLRDLRTQGKIPDAAWREIVEASDLKLDAEGPATATIDEKLKVESDWKAVIERWKSGKFDDPLTGEAGTRAWLTELKRKGSVVVMGVVCNQLAEASARQRGIKLTSGISANEGDFSAAAAKAAGKAAETKDGKVAVAPYFRHPASDDDFRAGSNLFFIDGDWVDSDPGNHAVVRFRSGHDYPVAPTPEYIKAWKEWDAGRDAYKKAKAAWDQKMKKAKTDAAKAAVGAEPEAPKATEPEYKGRDKLPANAETVEGWTYQVVEGEPITRTHSDGRKQWMKWSHQATVIKRVGKRVFTFETVKSSVWGEGSGMGERSTDELKNNLKVFIGWLPGDDPQYDAAPATPTAPATTAPPATTVPPPTLWPPATPGPAGDICLPDPSPEEQVCALPEPDAPTRAEQDARELMSTP